MADFKLKKARKDSKSYRLISLSFSSYKEQQASLRPSQVLNFTQNVESGFDKKEKTGVVFVNRSEVYDPTYYKIILEKVSKMTKN